MIHVDPAQVASHPIPAGPPADDGAAPARALIERQLVMLTRLAEIGMEIAEAAGRQAVAAAEGRAPAGSEAPSLRDPALAYARVARAVRMTIALQSRLASDLADLGRSEARAAAERVVARRARLRGLVTKAIEAEHGQTLDPRELERLTCDARECLEDAGDEADFAGSASFAEVVARICDDLSLSPDWTARLMAAAGGTPTPVILESASALIRDPGGCAPAVGSRDGLYPRARAPRDPGAPLRPG